MSANTAETSNGCLPLKHRPYRPQTSAKHVSDNPRHLIFRPPDFVVPRFVFWFVSECWCFLYYFEELCIFGRHRQILHEKLPHIDLLSALYDVGSGVVRRRIRGSRTYVFLRTKKRQKTKTRKNQNFERPFTPQESTVQPSNSTKTRFRRSPTLYVSTSNIFFSRCLSDFFRYLFGFVSFPLVFG